MIVNPERTINSEMTVPTPEYGIMKKMINFLKKKSYVDYFYCNTRL